MWPARSSARAATWYGRPAEDIIQPAASSSVWLDCNYWVTVRNDGGEDPALSRMLQVCDPSHQYVICTAVDMQPVPAGKEERIAWADRYRLGLGSTAPLSADVT